MSRSETRSAARPLTAGAIVEATLADRRARAAGLDRFDAERAPGASSGIDHVEDLLASFVADALGATSVRRDVSFSALGGDSLGATRVLARVWRAFEVKLPLSALAPDTTVRALAETVRRARDGGGRDERPLRPRAADGEEALSANQAAVWLAPQAGDAGSLYNVPCGLRIRGALQKVRLKKALEHLVVRHEALRLRFDERDGRPSQQPVRGCASVELPVVGLVGLAPEARERCALSLAEAHVRVPFDLARPPLLRALLIRLEREDHLLALAFHHVACDAWSIKLMLREMAERYVGVAESDPRAQSAAFLDFVAWQRATLDDAEVARLASGWAGGFGDAGEAMPGLTDLPRPERPSHEGAIEALELGAELVEDLRRLSGDQGVTLYMTLLSAFVVALVQRTRGERVTVGTSLANRSHETEGIVGYLANTLPVRVDCGGDPTLRELLGRVRTAALDVYDRQALPFARLVGELAPPRRAGMNPLFQVAMVLNDMSPRELDGVRVSAVTLHTGTAKLDLTCYLEEREGGLQGYLEYATALFDPRTIRRLRASLEIAIDQLLDDVDQRLSEAIAAATWTLDGESGSVVK